MYKPQPLQFFLDNIGHRIYRDKGSCQCKTCQDVEENGMIILDEQHAWYLTDIDNDFAREWQYSNYRLTK